MASLHVANELVKAVTNIIYPIGSIYISTNTSNPSSYLGGTWTQVAGSTYLIGYNPNHAYFDKPGYTVGSNGISGNWHADGCVLTINQIPSHNHTYADRMMIWDASGNNTDIVQNGSYNNTVLRFKSWGTTTMNSGGGQSHNHHHVLPFYTVVVWKRTA